MITKEEVKKTQSDWASGIIEIGKTKGNQSKCKKLTKDFLYNLYDFREGSVQFKPTRASIHQFRNNLNAAMSYFIANNKSFSEDKGFALTPWKDVLFENEYNLETDRDMMEYNATIAKQQKENEAINLRAEAAIERYRGKVARKVSYFQAGQSLLSTAAMFQKG